MRGLAAPALVAWLALATGGQAFAQADPGIAREGGGWTVNLRDADLRTFVEQISHITGQTFILDPSVNGRVSVISSAALDLAELYQLFLSVMASQGFSVLAQGERVRILPDAEATTRAGSGPGGGDQLETRVLGVQRQAVADLVPLLRPLMPASAQLAAVPSANALIVSDRSANIERIRQLVAQLDQAQGGGYSVLDLEHAWALDVAEVLRNTLARGAAPEAAGSRIVADSRTNRLVLFGPEQARRDMLGLARTLDVPSVRAANTRVIRLRHNDARALAETLGEVSERLAAPPEGATAAPAPASNVLIRADQSLNALVILAEPSLVATLESIVRQLDVPRAQVLVEAAIVEISGDISEALGVQWAIDARGSPGGAGGVSFGNTGLSIGTLAGAIRDNEVPANLPDGAIIGIGTRSFGALVTALSANAHSNLLSTPSLLTLDNAQAEILVGQNVPFQTGSYTTSAAGANNPFTTIQREDIGVTLRVVPHINEGATLRLEIEQEISSLAPNTTLDAQAVDLVTNKRSIKSTVLADDGQVIVLGGLIQDDVTRSQYKVPLLGSLPLIGALFRSTQEVQVKRNLMVFLRPSIVRDAAGIAALTGRKYSDLRIIDTHSLGSQLLPNRPAGLFERQQDGGGALDLRNPPLPPRPD